MRTRIVVLLLALVLDGLSVDAADPWIEVKSPNFIVVSDASERSARNVAWQFEQIRAAIQAGWPWARVQLDRPVTVVAARNENSMKLLVPGFWEKSDRETRPSSVFGTGAASHFIALRSDARVEDKGVSSADAIQQVFGSVEALEQAYLQYQKQPITQYARLKVETNASSKSFPVRALTPAEAAGVHAALHTTFGRPVEARAAIAATVQGEVRTAAGYDAEALLLDREGKRNEARTAYTKAVELSSASFYTHYRLATLEWVPRPDADTIRHLETLLRRSIALNNFYAPSQAMLADVIVQGPKPEESLAPATRAASLDPTSASARLTLARVLSRTGRRGDAMGHARAARSLARTDQERGAADEMIAFLTATAK